MCGQSRDGSLRARNCGLGLRGICLICIKVKLNKCAFDMRGSTSFSKCVCVCVCVCVHFFFVN